MKDEGKGVDLLEGWTDDENPFRASYIVRLRDIKESKQVAEQIEKFENVGKVQMKDKLMEVLIKISWWLRVITIGVIIIFIAISTFIIVYTIKLTVYARRREISIMKYVGATNSFIRWPFIVEGIILGLSSGIISLIIVSGLYMFLAKNITFVNFLARLHLNLLAFNEMFNFIVIIYLVLGMGIGVIGSTRSMKKYLKV